MTGLLIDRPFRELLEAFGSPDPAPGGGSASALAGAVGTALLIMVASLSRTRYNTDEDRRSLATAAASLRRIRDDLAALVEEDANAYRAVLDAYRLPRTGDADERTRLIQAALVAAIETPLATMRAAGTALTQAAPVARHGSTAAASDVGVAIALLEAAVAGADLNVAVNLRSLKDQAQAVRTRAAAEELRASAAARATEARQLLRAMSDAEG